jgi:hypothetical protein
MKVDSVQELESAFAQWRTGKKHAREAIPEDLRARAQRAATKHGMTVVARVTRVERSRLFRTGRGLAKTARAPSAKQQRVGGSVPTFSRLTLNAPTTANPRPIAEVESSGVTLRVFEQTPEMMALLSSACGFGAKR